MNEKEIGRILRDRNRADSLEGDVNAVIEFLQDWQKLENEYEKCMTFFPFSYGDNDPARLDTYQYTQPNLTFAYDSLKSAITRAQAYTKTVDDEFIRKMNKSE